MMSLILSFQLPQEVQGLHEVGPLGGIYHAVKGDFLQAVGHVLTVLDEPPDSERRMGKGRSVAVLPIARPTGQVAQYLGRMSGLW